MSKPRFFIVPAKVADTIIRRRLRRSWTDKQGTTQVLLSSKDLFAYGISKAIAEGAVEIDESQLHDIIDSLKINNDRVWK